MLYSAIVAICLASTPVQDCNRDTALEWLYAPEPQHGLGMCMLHAQQWWASPEMTGSRQRHEAADEPMRVKVFCTAMARSENVG